MDIAEILREREERLLDCEVRKNAEIVSSLLTDDFEEFGSSGRAFDKQQIIDGLQLEALAEMSLQDFSAQRLSDAIVLVTYKSLRIEAGLPEKRALRSSIWVLREGQWKLRFHQGTRIPNEEPSTTLG